MHPRIFLLPPWRRPSGSSPRSSSAILRQRREIAHVASGRQDEWLQLLVCVDRKAGARYGGTMSTIDNTLYDAFGQRQIATVYGPLTQYRVILEVDPTFRRDPDPLS